MASTPSASAPKSTPTKQLTEQEANNIFRQRTAELQAIATKIGELEREAEEHALVIETLSEAYTTEPTRKCFRLVGGVLVERTVEDVLPSLKTQSEQLKGVIETLLSEYKKKDTAFSEWQRENNIVVQQRP
ncbi:Prefoldin beta-like protein [Leucosporidium creatinivorum]|uniref:Prefoldin beta-like protein n=1 Tax=Leucosporidium creatinivorum TaxID=106004 RepID=A0A1Y2F9X6_9BASI|nr:Prefoldin beta-like protein [Leucosporidium creatinivorum]